MISAFQTETSNNKFPCRCCIFLSELLCVQAMEASFEKASNTLDSIQNVFDPSPNGNKPGKKSKSGKERKIKKESVVEPTGKSFVPKTGDSDKIDDVCFGFEDLNVNAKDNGLDDAGKKTPERIARPEKLDSDKKKALENVRLPECVCLENGECPSKHKHWLCISGSVSIAQFLMQAGSKFAVTKVMDKLQKYDVFQTLFFLDPGKYFQCPATERSKRLEKSRLKFEPELLSECLAACCIQAELCLNQKDYKAVSAMAKMVGEMEDFGLFENVLHQTLLKARLAVCEASAYLLISEQVLNHKDVGSSAVMQSDVQDTCTALQDLSISTKKKVSFGEEKANKDANDKTGQNTSKVEMKKVLDTFATPLKPKKNLDTLNTPKIPVMNQLFPSAKKSKALSVTRTPANRIQDLAALLDSDEENDIVFPDKKPVTPSVIKSIKKSGRARTEPKKSSKKDTKVAIPNVACKLDFISESGNDCIKTTSGKAFSLFIDDETGEPPNNGSFDESKKSKANKRTNKKVKDPSNTGQKDNENGNIADEKEDSIVNGSVLSEISSNDTQKDVFDFSFEASPHVEKSKTGAKSAKKNKTVKKKPAKTMENVSLEKETKENCNVANDSIVEKSSKGKRTRVGKEQTDNTIESNDTGDLVKDSIKKPQRRGRKKAAGDIEIVRQSENEETTYDSNIVLDVIELDIQVTEDVEEDNDQLKESVKQFQSEASPVINSMIHLADDLYEPIEVMRGDRKASRKTTRNSKQKKVEPETTESQDSSVGVEDEVVEEAMETAGNGKESMRSGRLSSVKEMSEKLGFIDEEADTVAVASVAYGKKYSELFKMKG